MLRELLRQISRPPINQLVVLVGVLALTSQAAFSNPTGGVPATPGTTISAPDANTVQVNQGTDKAIINWQTFNIDPAQKTQFVQPSASSIALNRVNPQNGVSNIWGTLSANGRLILINQAGIYFGLGSHVDVASIIASTADMSDENFLSGNYVFDRPSSFPKASVINEGTISAANYGLVALMGQQVRNDGTINARLGTIALGAGNTFTLNFDGDQLINFAVNSGATDANVTNNGSLLADGGVIVVSAKSASNVVNNIINLGGIAQARSVGVHNGEVILGGSNGIVNVTGKIIATAKHYHHFNKSTVTGGTVHISGNEINIASTAQIDVSGANGGGTVLIGGDAHGAFIMNSIHDGPAVAEANADTVNVFAGASVKSDATDEGDGGKIVAWSNHATAVHGDISAQGGPNGGNGGWVETSGHYLDVHGASISTLAANGKTGNWLLDPGDLVICNGTAVNCGLAPPNTMTNTTASFDPGTGTYNTTDPDPSYLLASDLQTALTSSDITLETSGGTFGSGIISVAAPISWTSSSTNPTSLTLNADGNIAIYAQIQGTHDGGIFFNPNLVNPGSPETDFYTSGLTIKSDSTISFNSLTTNSIVGIVGDLTLTAPTVSIAYAYGASTTSPSTTALTINTSGTNSSINGAYYEISGNTASLIKTGSGVFTITTGAPAPVSTAGLTAYSGGTTVQNGTLIISGASATAGTGGIVVNAGTLQLNGASVGNAITLANLSNITGGGTGNSTVTGPITISGTPNFNADNTAMLTIQNQITGTGTNSIVINGNGEIGTVQFQSSSNSYGPTAASNNVGTRINSGTFTISNAAAASTGTIEIDSGATLAKGGTVNFSLANNIGLAASGNETINDPTGTGTFTLQGMITNGGTNNNLDFTGATNIIANSSNNYAGSTSVSGNSTLQLASGGQLPDTTALTVNSGSTFNLNNISDTIGSLAGAGSVTLGTGTLTTGGTNLPTTFSGVISGSGSVVKQGTGTFTLTGGNTFGTAGTTALTVNNGTLAVSGSSAKPGNGNIVVASNKTLQMIGASFSNNLTLNAGSNLTGDTSSVYGNAGTGTITPNGTININSTGAFLSGQPFIIDGTITGTSTSALAINQIGSVGEVWLKNNNVYGASGTLGTEVKNGILFLGNTTAAGSGNILVDANAALYLDNSAGVSFTLGNTVTLSNNTYISANNDTYGGTLNLPTSGSEEIIALGSTNVTISGKITGGGTANTLTTQSGTGKIIISNSTNDYLGPTHILQSGSNSTLQLASGGQLSHSTDLTVDANATFDVNSVNNTIGSLTGPVGSSVTLGSGALTTGDGLNTNFNGVISGSAGQLIKQGADVFTLTNSNSYTGGTTVNAGILQATNGSAFGSGAVTVNTGGTVEANNISVANALNLNGPGASGVNGALLISGNTTWSGLVSLLSASTIGTVSNGDQLTLSGGLSGSAGLTSSGPGRVILTSNSNSTYSGPITVTGGILEGQNTGAFGTGNITVDVDGILQESGMNAIYGNNVILNGGPLFGSGIVSDSGTITLNTDSTIGTISNGDQLTLSGNLIGSSNLTSPGPGRVILTGNSNSTYSGPIAVTGGILEGQNTGAFGTGNITVDINGTLQETGTNATYINNLILNGGALFGSGIVSELGTTTLDADSVIGVLASSDFTLLNSIAGQYALTLNGPGAIRLNNSGTGVNVASLLVNSGVFSIAAPTSGSYPITTPGNQIYNTKINLDPNGAGNISFSLNTGNGNIYLNNGVSDGGTNNTLVLSGSGNNQFVVSGNVAVTAGVAVNGNNSGNSTLALNTANASNNSQPQNWNITGTNSGNASVNTASPGGFTFSGVKNLVGGSNSDSFVFAPGTSVASIASINGGVGPRDTFDLRSLPPSHIFLNSDGTYHGFAGNADFTFDNIDFFYLSGGSTVDFNGVNGFNELAGFDFINGTSVLNTLGEIYDLSDHKLAFYDSKGSKDINSNENVQKVGFTPVTNNSFDIFHLGTGSTTTDIQY